MQEADLRVMSPTDSWDVVDLLAIAVDAVAATPGACSDRGLVRGRGTLPVGPTNATETGKSVAITTPRPVPPRIFHSFARLRTSGFFCLFVSFPDCLPTEIISIHLKLILPAWRHHPVEEFS
jgi:hypothetical protein